MRRAALAAASIAALALAAPAAGPGPGGRLPEAEEGLPLRRRLARPVRVDAGHPDAARRRVLRSNEDRYLPPGPPAASSSPGPVRARAWAAPSTTATTRTTSRPRPGAARHHPRQLPLARRAARPRLGQADAGAGGARGRPLPHADPLHRDDLGPRPAAAGRGGGAAVRLEDLGQPLRPQRDLRHRQPRVRGRVGDVRGRRSTSVRAPGRSRACSSSAPTCSSRTSTSCEPPIRRQNTRVGRALIVGTTTTSSTSIGRLTRGRAGPAAARATTAWNTAVDENNHGLWLAAVAGRVGVSRGALEYTYAKVDKDATVAAFNTDDFFWGTGWEGHRARPRRRARVKSSSIHGIAQWQRFKDSPDPAVRDQWVTRYRLEWRTTASRGAADRGLDPLASAERAGPSLARRASDRDGPLLLRRLAGRRPSPSAGARRAARRGCGR